MKRTALALAMTLAMGAAQAAPKKKHVPKRPPTTAPASPAPSTPPESATPAPETAAPTESAAPAPSESATPPPAAPAAPPPPPAREEAPPPSGRNLDLDQLSNEYNQLRDELFRSRAKARLIGDALFKTKVNATLQYKAARAWPLKKVTLRIDEQPVFSADAPSPNDPIKLYDGFAAPGRHTLTVRVECGAVGEDRVGYGAEGTFVIDVPEHKETRVVFVVDESGDGPQKLAKKREGTFDVRVRADIEPVEIVK
jgi:hypothetical protein